MVRYRIDDAFHRPEIYESHGTNSCSLSRMRNILKKFQFLSHEFDSNVATYYFLPKFFRLFEKDYVRNVEWKIQKGRE